MTKQQRFWISAILFIPGVFVFHRHTDTMAVVGLMLILWGNNIMENRQ